MWILLPAGALFLLYSFAFGHTAKAYVPKPGDPPAYAEVDGKLVQISPGVPATGRAGAADRARGGT